MKKIFVEFYSTVMAFLIVFVVGFASVDAYAASNDEEAAALQQITVTGTVVDETGFPMAGVNILVKGTTLGTFTDADGKYTLSVPNTDAVLEFTFIGYETQTISVGDRKIISIQMAPAALALEEVVVVGYGTQKKVNLTGSVATVDNKVLKDRPITNIASGLQGLAPGVTITSGEGRPGSDGSTIRIRGVGTLNNANPYILIDGVESGTLNQLDPNDIESVSFLKDAASAAIYGSKASNGVILITTKRGQIGDPHVSYNGFVGFSNYTAQVEQISSADYARLYNRIDENNGRPPRYSAEDIRLYENGSDPYGHPNTDWRGAAFRTSIMHKHNVNINGGTNNVKYMMSVGYLGQQGILKNSDRQQVNARTNLDMNVTKKLTMRLNMAFIKNDFRDPNTNYAGGWSDQLIRQLNNLSPMVPIYNEDGSYGRTSDGNPISWLDCGQTVNQYNKNFNGKLSAEYTVFKGLKASITGAYVNNDHYNKSFVKKILNDPVQVKRPNNLSENFSNWDRYSLDVLLNYDGTFGKHNIKALAGYNAEKFNSRSNNMYRQNFPNNELDDMNAGMVSTQTNNGSTGELAMMSYFGRVNYDFAGKYLFEANFRADASSRFAPEYRWGYFPSFSGAWRISEENFMASTKSWLTNLKIRGSWGELGNQNAVSGDYYPYMNTYSLGAAYPFDDNLYTGYYQADFRIKDLSWEKATTYGIAIEATFIDKINWSIEYYDRKTTGIIMKVPVPAEFALGAYQDNVGSLKNSGIELQLGYHDHWGDWDFSVLGNLTYNKNKILNLGGVDRMPNGSFMRQIGYPMHSWFVYKTDGFFQSDQEAEAWMNKYGKLFGKDYKGGDLKYVDVTGDGKINGDDRILYKTRDPKITYDVNLNASWKNIDLTMNFVGIANVGSYFGNEAYGEFAGDVGHPSTAWLDSWTPENKDAKMPRVASKGTSPSEPSRLSDFWIVNTSYLRCKNLQLGYTLPKNWTSKVNIDRVRFYYSAENLFTIANLPINVDPETSNARLSNYPLLRTHSLGVNITF